MFAASPKHPFHQLLLTPDGWWLCLRQQNRQKVVAHRKLPFSSPPTSSLAWAGNDHPPSLWWTTHTPHSFHISPVYGAYVLNTHPARFAPSRHELSVNITQPSNQPKRINSKEKKKAAHDSGKSSAFRASGMAKQRHQSGLVHHVERRPTLYICPLFFPPAGNNSTAAAVWEYSRRI